MPLPLRSVLLTTSLLLFALLPAPAAHSHPPDLSAQYILSFTSYLPQTHHERTLRHILAFSSPSLWRLHPRPNLAAALPTDFLLFETPDQSLLALLLSHVAVHAVSPQSQHSRTLSSIRLPTRFEESEPPPHNVQSPSSLHPFDVGRLWRRGHTGRDVAVAVFDTGLLEDHRHFPNLVSQTDWTGENTTIDHVGHGTFVAGIIAGTHPSCPGLAPDVSLHVFRVFTASQVSYTSWFLDAFNYAMHIGIDVLNLSIGGPDFADNPFTEKMDELAAHGIIPVSAIGNDGPLWGSLNNPGDMMPVVGVGGIEPNGRTASFSSRGMTTHELDYPHASYGRVKPDLVTYARYLVGPNYRDATKCRRVSGTSFASPVVAGAIALLASTVPLERRKKVINSASVKRALFHSSRRLLAASMYEQGSGLLDVADAFEVMTQIDKEFVESDPNFEDIKLSVAGRLLTAFRKSDNNTSSTNNEKPFKPGTRRKIVSAPTTNLAPLRSGPQATFFPSYFDLRTQSCTYMWPHCAQPLYKGAVPLDVNVTIMNPGGVEGRVDSVSWSPGINGEYLRVLVTPPSRFWPWSAGLGVHISAVEIPDREIEADGILTVRIVSVHERTFSDMKLPIKANVVAPPPKAKRLLWDIYHSIRYPPGYIPRDSLAETKDMLDWLGDHPHTNFHFLFRELRVLGFFIDTLDQPLSCMGIERASEYGALLLLDSEDFFSMNDTNIIEELVKLHGMSLVVAAEWYNLDAMDAIQFEDDNTRSWWSPVIAGGNVPALNSVLSRFGIGLGDDVLTGDLQFGSRSIKFESGVPIVQFPSGGEVLYVNDLKRFEAIDKDSKPIYAKEIVPKAAALGLTKSGNGAVLVYGDTNCIDAAYGGGKCHSLFAEMVVHATTNCARETMCKRMLQKSILLTEDLKPSSTGGISGGLARGMSERLLNVFKPHSKYVLKTVTEYDGSVAVNDIVDDARTCAMRTGKQIEPREVVEGIVRSAVVLPTFKSAIPVGNENRYYAEYDRKARIREEGESSLTGVSADHRMDVLVAGQLRPVMLILLGLCMMFASISLRRMGQRGGVWRKHVVSRLRRSKFTPQTVLGRRSAASNPRSSAVRLPMGPF